MQRRRPPTLATLSLGLAVFAILPLVLQGATIVVPNSLAATEGDIENGLPFRSAGRVQQVFDASEFASLSGPELITQIAFRPDATFGSGFDTTITNIQINLSTTTVLPDFMSATFADNVGADDIVVFPAGPLALTSAFTGAGPKDFDIVINLQTPFLYDPTQGNLLLDVRNFSGEVTTFFDAHFVAADPVSRVATFTVADPTGLLETLGLVARFTTFPVDLLVSDAMTEIVHRYDGTTGADLGVFVPTLFPQNVEGLAYGPDGNLYIAARDAGIAPPNVINRYNGSTGAFIDRFAQGVCDGFLFPRAIAFHPTTGNVFVTCLQNNRIEEFNGVTGALVGAGGFTSGGVPILDPSDLCFSPVDGNLLVSDKIANTVLRYNGTTGVFIDPFVNTPVGGLVSPTSMAFDSANDLYVTGDVVGGIYGVARFDGGSGANKPSVGFPGTATFGVFAAASALPFDMVFLNDGNLAVSIPAANGDVKLLNGTTGAEMAPFVTSAVFPQQPFYMVVQSAPTPTPPTPTPTIETIIDAAEDLPAGSFKSPGHQNAVLSILADIQALIAAGDAASIEEAKQKLTNLRKRVDGCESGGVADNNDWITDCDDQDAIRALIDQLIAEL